MLDYMRASSGGCRFVVRGASDEEAVVAALRKAARAIAKIPHPEEPDDPLPNYVSQVTIGDEGPCFDIDVKDQFLYDDELVQQVLDIVCGEVEAVDANAEVGFPEGGLPAPEPRREFDPATVFIERSSGFDTAGQDIVHLAERIGGGDTPGSPRSVSLVLAPLAREICMRTEDDADRQALRPLAYRLANTADDEADRRRRARLLDWWVREETPRVLADVGVDAFGSLPSLAEAFETEAVFTALTDVINVIHEALNRFDQRCYRRGDKYQDRVHHIESAVTGAIGRVGDAGWRFYDYLHYHGRAGIEQNGHRLIDLAAGVIWRSAARSSWMTAWGLACTDASASATKPKTSLFPDWSDTWPPQLGNEVARAAAARMRGEQDVWRTYVSESFANAESWQAFKAKCERAGAGAWTDAVTHAMAARFDAVLDEHPYSEVVRAGAASFAEACQRHARYLGVMRTRSAAYENGASDDEADRAVTLAQRAQDSPAYERLRVILEELI
jgi:hypothetical protein